MIENKFFLKTLALTYILLSVFNYSNIPIKEAEAATGAIVENVNYQHTAQPYYRHSFYDTNNELFFVFHADYGLKGRYNVSADGSDFSINYQWTPALVHFPTWFNLWFDGTYVHYVYNEPNALNKPLLYRMGQPQADGSITWLAAEQTVIVANSAIYYTTFMVATDSSGYPWIGFERRNQTSLVYSRYVVKSSTKNGIWTTDTGFPHEINYGLTGHPVAHTISLVPLTSNKMYVIQAITGQTVKGSLYTGTWGSTEDCSASHLTGDPIKTLSSLAYGDDVYITFSALTSGATQTIKRTYGVGWGSPVALSGVEWAITMNTYTGYMYAFRPDPNTDYIYLAEWNGTTWEFIKTWIDETIDDLFTTYNCFYSNYGNYTGLVYENSHYDIKFAFLNVNYSTPSHYNYAPSDSLTLSDNRVASCQLCGQSGPVTYNTSLTSALIAQVIDVTAFFLPTILIIFGLVIMFLKAGLSTSGIPIIVLLGVILCTAISAMGFPLIPVWLGVLVSIPLLLFIFYGRRTENE